MQSDTSDFSQRATTIQVIEANGTSWMPHALKVMTDGYFPYVSAYLPQQKEERYQNLYRILCEDPYEQEYRSTTFAVLLSNPVGNPVVAGTVRFIIGNDSSHQRELGAIPAMGLLDVAPAWPHRQERYKDAAVGEYCRFAIAKEYRRGIVPITNALFRAGELKASALNLHMTYAIMPPKLLRIVQRLTFLYEEVRGISFRQTLHAQNFFGAFPGYWQQCPRLYCHHVGFTI